ncbi:hypothetical protein [Pandoraea commovens]|uniref:Uncharacterized protein n=1 Tax=Pandoraea commovens TaxID=2508289 RepID=A0A5E4WBC7_9BURK|nr:hypothetical protein [Pandoraea commovens]VVE20964.1 hypothetical protein PCO31010_03160 [Pandoraea commovens]
MPYINCTYRGCAIEIRIEEWASFWDVVVAVTPGNVGEFTNPFGVRTLKFSKAEELATIERELINEVRLAIDRRLVDR